MTVKLISKDYKIFKLMSSSIQANYPKQKNMDLKVASDSPSAIDLAVSLLRNGKVIAVPTDTVYGLACCATSDSAIEQLYRVKDRDENKPLAICLSDVSDLKNWAYVQHISENLLNSLLPGPVTLLLKVNNNTNLHSSLCKDGKVGVRIPNCSFIRNIVKKLGSPIALTSANISGEPSSTSIYDFENLWDNVACVFDGGVLSNIQTNSDNASTIVDLSKPGVFKLLRTGVAEINVRSILNKFNIKCDVNI